MKGIYTFNKLFSTVLTLGYLFCTCCSVSDSETESETEEFKEKHSYTPPLKKIKISNHKVSLISDDNRIDRLRKLLNDKSQRYYLRDINNDLFSDAANQFYFLKVKNHRHANGKF